MKAYLIALYTVIVLSIIGFIIGTLVFCFCDPRKAKEEENLDEEEYEQLNESDPEEEPKNE